MKYNSFHLLIQLSELLHTQASLRVLSTQPPILSFSSPSQLFCPLPTPLLSFSLLLPMSFLFPSFFIHYAHVLVCVPGSEPSFFEQSLSTSYFWAYAISPSQKKDGATAQITQK